MERILQDKEINDIGTIGRAFSDATIFMHTAIAKSVGLSGTDHKYLGLLLKHGAMTAGEFSKLTGLTTGAITGLVDRLEKKELAKREFDRGDRRKVMIAPNAQNAGRLLDPVFADLQSKMNTLIAQQSAADMEVIKKYMQSAIKVMADVTENLKQQ